MSAYRTSSTRSASATLASEIVEDIAAGIRVLRTRDGIDLQEDQIYERARNIAAGLIVNYEVASLSETDD